MDPRPRPLPTQGGKHHWSNDESFAPGTAAVQVIHHLAYAIGMHTHDFIEINIVTVGSGWHHLEDHVFTVGRGDAFIIPEGVRHGYEQRVRLDVEHLIVHPRFIREHLPRLQAVPGFVPLFTIEPYFRAEEGVRHRLRLPKAGLAVVINLLSGMVGTNDHAPAILADESLALAAIAQLCRAWSSDNPGPGVVASPRMGAVLAVVDTVEQRYAESLSLGDLASAADLTPSACCRLFRSVTGASPMEYLRQVRVRHAGLHLRSGLDLADVAARTGFYDAAHLTRVFRQISGDTPWAWRSCRRA